MDLNLKKSMSKKLLVVKERASLADAFRIMVQNNVRHLPVTNVDGEVIGILSDRDLQRAMKSNVSGDGLFRQETCEFNPENVVADYMSWPVKTLEASTTLKAATDKMLKEKVSCYLVTDAGRIEGIVTTDDLLKVLSALLEEPKNSLHLDLASLMSNVGLGRFAQAVSDSGI